MELFPYTKYTSYVDRTCLMLYFMEESSIQIKPFHILTSHLIEKNVDRTFLMSSHTTDIEEIITSSILYSSCAKQDSNSNQTLIFCSFSPGSAALSRLCLVLTR